MTLDQSNAREEHEQRGDEATLEEVVLIIQKLGVACLARMGTGTVLEKPQKMGTVLTSNSTATTTLLRGVLRGPWKSLESYKAPAVVTLPRAGNAGFSPRE